MLFLFLLEIHTSILLCNSQLWVIKRINNKNLKTTLNFMSSDLCQPCSPVPRPIKFLKKQGQMIFQCSFDVGAGAPISYHKEKQTAALPSDGLEKNQKQSILTFLKKHERKTGKRSQLEITVL